MAHRSYLALAALTIGLAIVGNAHAEEAMTLRDVTAQLFHAEADARPDLAGKNLSRLDLSDLDFKHANLAGSDLYGADLSRAKLNEADLTGARLDRTLITSTDFSGAILNRTTILRPAAFTTLEVVTSETPRFTGAKMVGAEIHGLLDRTDFRAADLTSVSFLPRDARVGTNVILARSSLVSCNFSDTILKGAIMAWANLSYARFNGADLRGANLRGANLTRADFTNANLAGADVTGANIDEADLRTAQGLDEVIGLGSTENRATALSASAP